ncbi:hypothetical protein [Limosilactobacillus fermentum]|uniref:hypothetical protein n=1 Tax=Limosilactobacillus fermentum TaxID=1613 RepID=UPI0022444412|nr:hypothetical protein [Limosilactobacillus fermentum]UZM86323.1 hypothetical protein OP867_02800 [Limosilactobacillus fermentum]
MVLVAAGGWLAYATHSVASAVPGHVYKYTGANGKQAYMTFSATSDAVVSSSKQTALSADQSTSGFNKAYQEQTEDQGTWTYKGQGSHLTVAVVRDGKSSQWQYDWVTVLGSKLYSPHFTYQIADAGSGISKKATNFERID